VLACDLMASRCYQPKLKCRLTACATHLDVVWFGETATSGRTYGRNKSNTRSSSGSSAVFICRRRLLRNVALRARVSVACNHAGYQAGVRVGCRLGRSRPICGVPRARRTRGQSHRRHHRQPKREERRKRGACIDPHGYDAGKKIKGKKRGIMQTYPARWGAMADLQHASRRVAS
jgi:hypothetical protein